MAEATPLLTDFTGGELGAFMAGRVDLPIYTKGCSKLENWIPFSEGGVRTKPGSAYLGLSKTGQSGVLLPFVVADGLSFLVELTPLLIRIWQDDSLYGAPLELATPYADMDEMREVRVAQDGPRLFMFHRSYTIRMLYYTGATFTFTAPTVVGNPDQVPFSAAGDYPAYGVFFGGRMWCGCSTNEPEALWASRSYVYTYGDPWQITTGYEVDMVVENDSGKLYKCVTKGVSAGAGGPTGTGSGIVDGTCKWDYWTAAGNLDFTYSDRLEYSVEQLVDPADWTDPDVPEIETVTNYRDVVSASNALNVTLMSERCDQIQGMIPGDSLLVATLTSEYIVKKEVSAIDLEENINRQTRHGGDRAVQGLMFQKNMVFLQHYGTKLREYRYSADAEAWDAPDLTLQNREVLGSGGAVDMDLAMLPQSSLLLVLANGDIACLVKDDSIGLNAWCRLGTESGAYESVAVIQGSGTDAVYTLVNRGAGYVCLEKTDTSEVPIDSWHVEDVAGATILGLERFALNTLTIYNATTGEYRNGVCAPAGTYTVHADDVGDELWVGVPIICTGRTMRITTHAAYGQGDLQQKRVGRVLVRVNESYDFKVGFTNAAAYLEETVFDTPPFTGDHDAAFQGTWDRDAWVYFVQDEPYPVTILAMIPEMEI